jgi:RNA polymerase sigma-70 factor, ECF subfamily
MMKRLHTSRGLEAIKKIESAVVYAFPASSPVEENRKTRVKRAVYLSHSTVDLYTFDAAYLARLRARHPETLAHFGAYFTRLLTIKLRSAGLPKSGGDDVRQETLLRVLNAVQADKVEEPEKLGPYVFSVCKHVTQEWWRSEQANRNGDGEEAFEFPDPATGPEEAVRAEEIRKTAAWVLEQIPEKDRKILIAVFIDEQEKDDICRAFNISREYLRVLVHRALRSAREKLGGGPES